MMRRFVLLLMLLAAAPAAAQTDEVVRAALYLTGADSPEELDDRLVDDWTTASSMNWNPSGTVPCRSTALPGRACWTAGC